MTKEEVDWWSLIQSDMTATYIGRATIAWNTVSEAVFGIFEPLSGLEENAAKAVFFCIKSDRSQRDMLTELIKTNLEPSDSKLAAKILSKIGSINALAGKRNDIQHVVIVNPDIPGQARLFHDVGFLKGKEGKDLIFAIHGLTIECMNVATDLLTLATEVWELMVSDERNLLIQHFLEVFFHKNGHQGPIRRHAVS